MRSKLSSMIVIFIVLTMYSALSSAEKLNPLHDPDIQRIEPFKVFDNLYYVGAKWVSCWLIDTGDGLILIDSLYGGLVDIAIDGIRALGLDPKEIKYVLVTHAHYDHIGGAKQMQDSYGATVAMVQEDWTIAAGKPVFMPYPKPAKQLVIDDGDTLSLGNTHFTFYKTPGHTAGVMSMKFNVIDNGRNHTAFMFSGVGLNFKGVERTQMYIDSVKRLKTLEGIEVNIPNHGASGDIFKRNELLKLQKPGQAHSFIDASGFSKWLDKLLANAESQMLSETEAVNK